MKETIQLSIGGYAFTLEKDAAQEAEKYITGLEQHYLPQNGGKEIMEGIEERMAELLVDKCNNGDVVKLEHIQAVIDIIGKPERIEADDPEPAPGESPKGKKKLFRDMEDKRLGGVCSGLAAYFGVDVTWIRAGFVVATLIMLFTGWISESWSLIVPVIYCILWIAMPAARTPQDRWAMKGESGTADEIRRNVQQGIHEMGNAASEVVHSDFFQNFGRVLLVIVGFVMLIIGTSGLASVSVLSFKGPDLFGLPFAEWIDDISESYPAIADLISTPWVIALAALAIILPLVGILYAGIQLIFGFKNPSWKPGLVIFVLWLIVIIVLLVLLIASAASAQLTFA
ncbi:MAG: PspC domain-containing protein [Bacteroidales bacterium]|nr:PspC domain-containing protein [Bacteroidales bacterium]